MSERTMYYIECPDCYGIGIEPGTWFCNGCGEEALNESDECCDDGEIEGQGCVRCDGTGQVVGGSGADFVGDPV